MRSICTYITGCRLHTLLLQMLKEKGYIFDIAFTSVLKRAIKTLYHIQNETDLHWIPVVRHWRLNERKFILILISNSYNMYNCIRRRKLKHYCCCCCVVILFSSREKLFRGSLDNFGVILNYRISPNERPGAHNFSH